MNVTLLKTALRKRYLWGLLALGISGFSQAQTPVDYTFSTNTTSALDLDVNANAIDMSTGTTQIVVPDVDDAASVVTNIGFTFHFSGVNYTQFSANSNGSIALGSTAIAGATYSTNPATASFPHISAMGGDLRTGAAGKVHYKVVGLSPNRTLVVEFLNMSLEFVATPGSNDGTFQIRLYETTGLVEFVYGSMYRNSSATNSPAQTFNIGMATGTTATTRICVDTNNVTSFGTLAVNNYPLSANMAKVHSTANGSRRAYIFTPPPNMAYGSSEASQVTLGTAPGKTNVHVVSFKVTTTGASNPLSVTSLNVSTNGTTSLTDITNLKVYYTGTSNTFATTNQFGTTVAAPAASQAVTGTRALVKGDNYFWVTYDVSPTATVGNQLDAEIGSVTVGGTPYTPTIAAPVGGRQILSPMSGPYLVGSGSFTSITAAIAELNARGASGPIEFVLNSSSYTKLTGEVFPLTIGAYTGMSATNTLSIYPANGFIASIVDKSASPLFILDGAKYVTFDGRQGGTGTPESLIIQNDSAHASAAAITLQNDASYNKLQYAIFKASGTTSTVGVINFGTGVTTGNDSNFINSCQIGDAVGGYPSSLIQSLGSTDVVAKYNDYNRVVNCNLFNFWNATAEANAFKISNGNNFWTVMNNSIYQTSLTGKSSTAGYYTFNYQNSSNLSALNGMIVTGNYIGGSAPLCAGTPWLQSSSAATMLSYFNLGNTAMSRVSSNTFANINIVTTSTSTTGGGAWNAIQYVNGMLNIDSNIIGSLTDTGSVVVQAGSAAVVLPISATASNTTGTYSIGWNKIGGIRVYGGGTVSNNLTLINITSATSSQTYNITGNILGNTAADNIITGPSSSTTVQTIRGINNTSAGNLKITNNQIRNFRNSYGSTGSSAVIGIATSSGIDTISGNLINTFSAFSASTSVLGITVTGGTTFTTFRNKIYDLMDSAGTVIGISITGGTTNTVYNNAIGDLRTPFASAANSLIGISITGGTTSNIYYNTVYLNGVSTGTNFGSSAISASASPTTINLRNNIFVNASTPNGTGLAVAYRRASTALGNYGSASNNNLFYGGTPGTSNLIFTDGTNNEQALATYKTRVGNRDSISVSEQPSFLSTTGSASNFLAVNPAVSSQIESGAANITSPAIATDFFGNIRQGNAGYPAQSNGGGTKPDIGASEYDGVPLSAPSVSGLGISPTAMQCVATARTATATATPGSGTLVSVMLNYSFNGVAQTAIAMTNTSGNTWSTTIPAAVPGNATVTWSVTATNSFTLTNSNPGPSYKDEPFTGTSYVVTAASNPVCLGKSTTLTNTFGTRTAVVGAGATTSSVYPDPYYSLWSNTHNQYLIRASELQAAGLSAGNITSLAFEITAGTLNLNDVTVKMANTAATDVSTFINATFTNVFSSANVNRIIGVNKLTFSAPFAWDGTSNVVIELCHGNSGSSATMNSTALVDNTSYISTIHTHKSAAATGASSCSDLTTNLTTYSIRPKFTFTQDLVAPQANYSWSDGLTIVGTTRDITVSPTVNTTYTLTVSDINGCSTTLAPFNLNVVNTALGGVYSIGAGGTYPTITAAINALNTICSVSGNITYELLDANYNKTTGETFPIVINNNAAFGPGFAVTIRPANGITSTISGNAASPLIRLNGARFVTIDGRQNGSGTTKSLTIQNDSVLGSAIQFINDASRNLVEYTIMKGASNAATNGVVNFSTALSLGNDSNTIDNCDIGDGATTPATLVQSLGSTDSVTKYNDYNVISNCNLYNFWHASAESNAFKISGGNNFWTITGNSIYQTASRSGTTGYYTFNLNNSGTLTALNGMAITYNYIGGSAPQCGGTPWTQTSSAANQNSYFNMGNVAMSKFSNNTINNYNFTTTSTSAAGAGAWNLVQYINGRMNIDSNVIGSLTDTAGIKITAGNGGGVIPISITASNTAGVYSVTGNKFGGIKLNGGSNSNSLSCIFITSAGNTITYNVEKNQIGVTEIRSAGVGSTTGQSVLGIYNTSSAIMNIRNNTVRNLINAYTGLGTVVPATPGQTVGIASTAGTVTINQNMVNNLENATAQVGAGGLSAVIGIAATSTATAPMEVTGNTIYALRHVHATAKGSVYGILYNGGTGIQAVNKNFIHSFTTVADSAQQAAIVTFAGTARVFNNMIRLGIDTTGASQSNSPIITGLGIAGGNIRAYFNSVYIGGTAASGGANSYAINRTATGTDSIHNNIFVNQRTGGTGSHVAIRLSNNTNLKANTNLYYVGSNPAMGIFNVTAQAAIGNWKTAAGVDGNSNAGNPSFLNPAGDIVTMDLHISTFTPTPVEGSGGLIAGIDEDFDGNTRSGLTPTDIGADAGNFILSDIFPPNISYTAIVSDTNTTSRILLDFATITDASGVDVATNQPRLYFKKSTDNNVFGGNTSADNGWKYVTASNTTSPFSFTINYSIINGGAVGVGDSIQYFVAAQDLLGSVGANPAAGFVAASVNSVTAAPSPVNVFRIRYKPLNGLYNVGAGQTAPHFPTLTSAINTLNDAGVAGPVTFNLIDANYSTSEVFPLVINEPTGLSAVNTLTIKPGTGVVSVITGSSASSIFKLNSTDYVTIDGSNTPGGSTRNLSIINTSGLGSTAVIWLNSFGVDSGAHHNTIKNIILSANSNVNLTYGIFAGGATIADGGLGAKNNYLNIQNNWFRSSRFGVHIGSIAVALSTNIRVINNKIDDTVAWAIGRTGINVFGADTLEISGNAIGNFADNATTGVKQGIYIKNNTKNIRIFNNNIYEIVYTGVSGYAGQGIVVESATTAPNVENVDIYNNQISGMKGDGDAYTTFGATYTPSGIYLRYALTNVRVLFNSINLYGNTVNNDANCLSAGIALDDNASATVMNNLIVNKLGLLGTTGYGAVGILLEQGASQLIQSNYNDIYVATTNTSNFTGKVGATDYTTLAAWRTAVSKDAKSVSTDVTFTTPNDLKLAGASIGNHTLAGTAIAGITTDFEGDIRHLYPYMGADENVANPLPVKLLLFTARAKGSDVLVSWTTATEINNKGFDVERSADGKTFAKVDFVKGAGNSTRALSYKLNDAGAFKAAGSNTLYYRLKQMDFSGDVSYSSVVMVTNDVKPVAEISVYPNPFTDKVQVHIAALAQGEATIKMFDISGRMITEKSTMVNEGVNMLEIDQLAELERGIYFIVISQNGESSTHKMIKN